MQLNQFKGRQRECMFPDTGTSTLNHWINILVKRSGGIEPLFVLWKIVGENLRQVHISNIVKRALHALLLWSIPDMQCLSL